MLLMFRMVICTIRLPRWPSYDTMVPWWRLFKWERLQSISITRRWKNLPVSIWKHIKRRGAIAHGWLIVLRPIGQFFSLSPVGTPILHVETPPYIYKMSKNRPVLLNHRLFIATSESILIYGSSTWTTTRSLKKELECIYTDTDVLIMARYTYWCKYTTNSELHGRLSKLSENSRLRLASMGIAREATMREYRD